ncbi:MAG: 2-phospho-L-lactate transferase [Gammaproteobacteria bacterium]|nr:2-phospho-L-lactate transferase [Gammaproteobacteria bacterium]
MAAYLALTGGVGGAKLALGLAQLLGPDELAFLVNTGDDFEHLGLHVSPDVDTLTYSLADLSNPETGWGRRGESWNFIETLKQLGGESWFNLGDRDLALHVMRTQGLRAGRTLTEITREISRKVGIAHLILPMSDDAVRTMVQTVHGSLSFQHYFVRERCEPSVTGFEFVGAVAARANPALATWLARADFAGVILCPSNPYVSIDPMLAIPGIAQQLRSLRVPIVAISPIVAGLAIKGPTAKMMRELNVPQTAVTVASHYRDLLDGFIVDVTDEPLLAQIVGSDLATIAAPTVMITLADKIELARITLEFIRRLKPH